MKKWFSCLVAGLFLVCLTPSSLALNSLTQNSIIPNQPGILRYEYTTMINAGLSFSGGKALCDGVLDPSTNDSCSITVTLYKQNGSSWSKVTSWSGSASNGRAASAGGSISVSRGTYKVTSSGNVGGKEFPTKSVTRTY